MREIFVNDGMTSILLGRKGENEATKITFDIADWIAEYPQATFALINQKPNSTTEYPVVISQPRDGKVSWVVGGNELLTDGYGQCTLEAVEGNVVAKRHIWRTRILTAMGEPGEFPEPWESWLTEFTRLKGEAEDAQEASEDAAEDSEAWAVGQRGGVDVDDEDPTYENNAKYYAILAQTALDTALAQAEAAADAAETAQGKAEDAQEAAEDAQADAEAAQAAAELAKSAAETAQGKAEDAQEAAEDAQAAAESSASDAEDAQSAAETAQSAAATSAATANTARAQTENMLAAAITAKNAAETAQGKAEDAQDAAEDAQEAAEEAQTAAEAAQAGALVAQGKAEDAQEAAETAQGKAEDAQEAAETAQGKAEDAQEAAEAAQTAAEAAQSAAEDAQEAAEAAQEAAEEAAEEALETVESKAPAIYEEASGEIVSITDGAGDMKVKKLEVEIEPVQDLHGYESPWPAGGNVNLLPNNVTDGTTTSNGITCKATNGVYVLSGTATAIAEFWFDLTASVDLSPSTNKIAFLNSAQVGEVHFYRNNSLIHYWAMNPINRVASNWTDSGNEVINKIAIKIPNGTNLSTPMTISPMLIKLTEDDPTSFSPYSNVCPISGWDSANVSRTGKNLFDKDSSEVQVNKYLNSQGEAVLSYSQLYNVSHFIRCDHGMKLYVNNPGTGNIEGAFYDAFKVFIPGSYISDNNLQMTAPENAVFFRFDYKKEFASSVQCEIGTSASAYTPYSGSTTEYAFPEAAGTVYGGTLTIHQDGSGELVVDRACVDMGTLDWVSWSESGTLLFNVSLPGKTHNRENPDCISSMYKYRSVVSIWSQLLYGEMTGNSQNDKIYVRNNAYTSNEAFKAGMSGKQIVYTLAEPIVYQLTNQQVLELLKGNNVCFADCGSISLEYPADTKLYIDGKIAEIQALILENISNS